MPAVFLFLWLFLISCVSTSLPADGSGSQLFANGVNRGYIFTAPKRLIAGEAENVCLSLHNLEPPVHVSIDLLAVSNTPGSATPSTNPEDDILASVRTTFRSGSETCFELRVTPNTKHSVGKLRLRLKFEKHKDYTVDAEKKVFIDHDSLVTFVETDKAIYKPGQVVNIRVLTLKHDFKPWIKPISKLWIENPSEVRVAQWTNISTENGMVQLTFPLSSEPSSGIWKIKVEKTRPQLIHTSSFEVRKYVLPRFQVTIGAPNYILADAHDATWKICVRYSYQQPVKGNLLLSLRPQTPIWKRKQTIPDIKHEEKMEGTVDGCTNYTVSAELLGLPHWKIAPNNVVLVANFTEAKSGVVETATSRTVVMHQPLKLEFSPHTPKYFKPGLPYHGKLRVLKPDASSPVPNEKIQLCLRVRRKDEWQRSVVECRNFTSSNAEGFLDFIVPPQPRSIVLLSFVATAVDYPTKYYSPDKRWRVFVDQPSAYIDVEPWYSPSSSYLSISRGYQPIVCGEKYSFNVMYTAGNSKSTGSDPEAEIEPVTFHYSINSKGDLLVFGHVKYKPRKDTLLDYSEFRNVLGANPLDLQPAAFLNSTQSSQHAGVHRFPLSVKITASMAPMSELLLYYVRADGEVVSSSHSIEVGHCFENPVKTAWHEDKQAPGSLARFHIEAAPFSLCGLSAVDRSTRFLKSVSNEPNILDSESVFARLKSFHLSPDSLPLQGTWAHCSSDKSQSPDDGTQETDAPEEEIDHLPRPQPIARRKRHSVTYNIGANYVDAVQAFDDFGAIVISDLVLESRPCPPWRSNLGRVPLGLPGSADEVDEPDRMLKAVKAMPLAFQFSGPVTGVADPSVVSQELGHADPMSLELRSNAVVRSYFPETWIWDLVSTGKDGKAMVERKLPDTITDWIGNTVCISVKNGLGISTPAQITAFQSFFLDYSLPYSVKRSEQLRLKVFLFNYMHYNLPVSIRLSQFEGFDLNSNQSSEIFYCVDPKDSIVHEYILFPRILGEVNITVTAEIDLKNAQAKVCGPEPRLHTKDEIVKPVLVKPEGFPVEITRSSFLCPKDFTDDTALTWEIDLPTGEGPDRMVEGSARAYVSVIGDILGPALDNLEQLVRLPMGCGEQNMILFVPNVHAIGYLDAVNRHAATEMRSKALRNMMKGYQRQLNYRHPDGSYSAFGPTDEETNTDGGSMWLTAFVVKSFAQARSLISIDERDLKLSVKWIVRRQLENGCFPVVGQVFHKDMKGGLREEDGSSSALTAYVLVALLESGVSISASLVNNALYCLEKASLPAEQIGPHHEHDSPYNAALSTYALALLEHPRANESLRQLLNRATRQGDYLWWEDKSRSSSLALSIEMTAYGLLSLVKLGGESNMLEALRAVRWLSRKRNAEGGFSSTQDTVMGLEALTKYALAMANTSTLDLSLLVTATDFDHLFRVSNENRMLLKRMELPTLPTSLEVLAEGEGCVLVQSSLRYNKYGATGSDAFELTASSETVPVTDLEAINDRCAVQQLSVCTRYKLPDEESNMAVIEISMVSGFTPDKTSLHDLLEEQATGVKRFEENADTVVIYFDKLTFQKTCINFRANRENVVDNPEPGTIKLYDYYQRELTVSAEYRFAEACDEKPAEKTEGTALDHESDEPEAKKMQQKDNRLSVEEMPREVNQIIGASAPIEKKAEKGSLRQRSVTITARPVIFEVIEGSGIEVEQEGELIPVKPVPIDMDAIEEGFSPAFVNVDHELEFPDGMEGPIPVFVEAPNANNVNQSSNSKGYESKAEDSKAVVFHEECPRCEEQVPTDLKELFCTSSSVAKVAIRRLRKARLLLDLSTSELFAKRLRITIELNLDSKCTCAPLDKPGNMALLLSSAKEFDFSKLDDKIKVNMDNSMTLIVLPSIIGAPIEVKEAQLSCPTP